MSGVVLARIDWWQLGQGGIRATMGDKFSVQPDQLILASARFTDDAEQLASALGRLRSHLHALGDYCGGDDQGRQFAQAYDPKVAMVDQALQNLTHGLADIARGLEVMAVNYRRSDGSSQVKGG